MVRLKKLRKYDEGIYNSFLSEVVRIEGLNWVMHCVHRNHHMTSAVVFRNTVQGSDYWWGVISRIEKQKVKNSEKV